MRTNLHITQSQASTMLEAVRYQLADQPDDEHLQAAERMLLAALARISDATDKRDKKGIWA